MLAIPVAHDAGDIDRRFLLDGAYRSQDSLSLAECSEYGLRAPSGTFDREMSSALATSFPPGRAGTINDQTRQLRAAREDREICRWPARPNSSSAKRTAPPLRQTIACDAPRIGMPKRGIKNPGLPDRWGSFDLRMRAGVHFRVRAGGYILIGVAHRGKLAAIQLLDSRSYGTVQPD